MEADGVSDDLRRDKNTIQIVSQKEDEQDPGRVDQIAILGEGNEDRRDQAEHHSQIGDQAEDPDHETDKERKVEAHKHIQREPNHSPVDKTDKKLPPEKVDQIVVDLVKKGDNLLLEGR